MSRFEDRVDTWSEWFFAPPRRRLRVVAWVLVTLTLATVLPLYFGAS